MALLGEYSGLLPPPCKTNSDPCSMITSPSVPCKPIVSYSRYDEGYELTTPLDQLEGVRSPYFISPLGRDGEEPTIEAEPDRVDRRGSQCRDVVPS
jgi:hypothetical protein